MELESRDLGYFAEGVRIASLLDGGFVLADVEDIPAAWQTTNGSLSLMGWIVALDDGRHVYLQYSVDEAGSGLPQEVRLRDLSSGEPAMLADLPVAWFEPHHVNLVVHSGRWQGWKAIVR